MTNAFALDKRVLLQAKGAARDALNKPLKGADNWVNALPGDGKIWARITDITGRQYVAAGGNQNAVQTEILIRRRAGVLPSMRVLHGPVAYDIEAVLERDQRWTVLMCTKGLPRG
jgi:SPP1 family predicted phage head-tail adaptor